MKIPKLTPRLALIASLVPKDVIVADIGTDHAYIPAYLVNSGVAKHAIASDILDGPLKAARETVEHYGCGDKVELRKSDGLAEFSAGEADTLIIAGMGGVLIAKILENGGDVAKSAKRLILQPMTAAYEVRKYLHENGYFITEEHLAREGDKLYNVIVAEPRGEKHENIDEVADYYVGRRLIETRPPHFIEYVRKIINKFEVKLAGLAHSSAEELDMIITAIEQILENLEGLL
ncbi:MAG: class I SAM-dependent methyltransferase [Oscillospiraceae bacterium]|nr:class I SAM-dependent methyltransferase [Oscillospiraceae bacterium]